MNCHPIKGSCLVPFWGTLWIHHNPDLTLSRIKRLLNMHAWMNEWMNVRASDGMNERWNHYVVDAQGDHMPPANEASGSGDIEWRRGCAPSLSCFWQDPSTYMNKIWCRVRRSRAEITYSLALKLKRSDTHSHVSHNPGWGIRSGDLVLSHLYQN